MGHDGNTVICYTVCDMMHVLGGIKICRDVEHVKEKVRQII